MVAKHRRWIDAGGAREAPPIDLLIVGAGPVGSAVAALAARPGIAIEIFEARATLADDARILALSHATRELLEGIGAWPTATAIASIHVSQKGAPGRTVIDAREQSLPALGYTVEYAALEAALMRVLEARGIEVHRGESCEEIALGKDAAQVHFASGHEARARLLVLADGGANARKIPGIAFREKDYRQQALVATVTTDRPHDGRAYERFAAEGPIALLPFEDRYGLVWTAAPAKAANLLALDEAQFLRELQAHFGDRAGRFVSISARVAFPLRLRTINTPVALRTAMVGSAAQALHPVAGQGLNLGLRDAAALASAISACEGGRIGEAAMLAAYRDSRRGDASRGAAFTDFLVGAFAGAWWAPKWARGAALTALDLFPPARRAFAERMVHGPAP